MFGVVVEPTSDSGVDLSNVVFDQSVVLGRVVVVVGILGEPHHVSDLVHGTTTIGEPHGLVPHQLDRIAIARRPTPHLVASTQRRPMRADQMLGVQRENVIDSRQKDHGIPIFLASNRVNVEHERPDDVLHAQIESGEPQRDGIVGIRWSVVDVQLEPGDGQSFTTTPRQRDRYVTRRERCVVRISVVEAESDVHLTVRTVERQTQRELLHDAPHVGGCDLRGDTRQIDGDSLVPVDGQIVPEPIENFPGATHVMEMRVDDSDDRPIGDRSQFVECRPHLLHRLTRVDSDDPFGSFHERLIGQPVADQAPHTRPNRVQTSLQPFALFEGPRMSGLSTRTLDNG